MAQVNGGSVIERHLEKIVLGVCALALLYGLFRWGFGSPRKLESENLPLRRIDEELLAKAAAAEAAAKKATIVTKPLPDYDQAIQTLQSADFGSSSSRMVDLGFAREALKIHVGPLVTRVKPSVAELSKLPAPGGPEGRARMELPNTAGELKDARAYHAALVYPWASVARLWQEKLAQTIIPGRDRRGSAGPGKAARRRLGRPALHPDRGDVFGGKRDPVVGSTETADPIL